MPIMNNHQAKKVAILYSGGKSLSGIEKYLIHLFENIDKNQFELELLSLGEWPLTERLKILGFSVNIFSARRINFGSVKDIGQYCQTNKVELLVSQGTVANAYARLVSKFYKIPNLVTVHSDASSEYPNFFIRNIYWLVDRLGRRATVSYIAVSKYLEKVLVGSGVPASKIKVIYNGSDYPKAKAKQHKRLVIGSVGRLDQVKGYDLLIQAFALIKNKRIRLKIAGEGDELANLKQLAVELGVSGRVELTGYKTDVFEFLNTIDVYVQPSRCEGFGVALVQAMSQNLPVVVTPAGSLPEIVKKGETGYISYDMTPQAIAKAISQAIENISQSTKIGENAGRYVNANFLTKTWVDKTSQAYKEAMK